MELLPATLLSYTFKHFCSLNLLYHFPTGLLDTEYQVFISYSAPLQEWHQHDYFFFHEEQLSIEITAFLEKKN